MKSMIRLFKAVEVSTKRKKKLTKELLMKTVKRGFVFSPEVVANHPKEELDDLIGVIETELGLTAEQMNNSFHKSWKKVKDTDLYQLFLEQITHYFTTYGFEAFGVYNEESVYVPNEKLEIPELEDNIKLVVIRGYTKKELKEKLMNLLETGIAIGEETLEDIEELITHVGIAEKEIERIKNKEIKMALYKQLGLLPENPVEFLRYAIYTSIGKTLLIKDEATIDTIKATDSSEVLGLFIDYKNKHGLNKLAQIFNRFKPIFLAFKKVDTTVKRNSQMSHVINKIRKLAIKHHKPMKEDYLNEITAKIKNGKKIELSKLKEELAKVNTFRKIRLAYALKFRTKDASSILYRIRNGKGFATEFKFGKQNTAKRVLNVVLESITSDIKKNVKGKKIYIPDDIMYTLPATEKQFTGDLPSGSYVKIPKDMIVGVHWEDTKSHRIDLDLSMVNLDGKIGWDSAYRSDDQKILFSGDMTSAPRPKGASELFYVRRQSKDAHILFVNYYNFDEEIEVPFKIVVAKEQAKNFGMNYMVNPNNVLTVAKTKIDQKQKILGLLVTTSNECRFYFAETSIGNSITSSSSELAKNSRNYLLDFYSNTISLNDVLKNAGAKFVTDKSKSDIDLSPENLEKDKIINLIK